MKKKDKSLLVKMDEDDVEMIRYLADSQRTTISAVVRRLIRNAFLTDSARENDELLRVESKLAAVRGTR